MSEPKQRRPGFGLLGRRECLVPTRRGWLVLVALGAALALGLVRGLHPFLVVNAPVHGRVLAVEGWAPDYVLREALAEFRRGQYAQLCVTGGPIELGAPLAEYGTYAELGAAVLIRLGGDTNVVQAVPCPAVVRDRTFASGVALRNWLAAHGGVPSALDVMSSGAHSRRTRLLFEKAFGNRTRIGVYGVDARDYDSRTWWQSSQGVRVVIGELVAYTYARLAFRARGSDSP